MPETGRRKAALGVGLGIISEKAGQDRPTCHLETASPGRIALEVEVEFKMSGEDREESRAWLR